MTTATDGRIDVPSDSGHAVSVVDVVGGRAPQRVRSLQSQLLSEFPEHAFAAHRIADDARRCSIRDGLVVHQWIVCIDDEPVGLMLHDTNLVRRVSPVHFLVIAAAARPVTIGGRRLAQWLAQLALEQAVIDGGPDMLGLVGETPADRLHPFVAAGWRVLPAHYVEPVHGWTWRAEGLEVRSTELIWLPGMWADPSMTSARIVSAASAAFLLDTYDIDRHHPAVTSLVSDDDLTRRAPIRGAWPSVSAVTGSRGR